MKTIQILPRQSLFDIAVQEYGTLDGIYKIIEDNPNIKFDTSYKDIGITEAEHTETAEYGIDLPLIAEQSLSIDTEWEGRNVAVLNTLNKYKPVSAD